MTPSIYKHLGKLIQEKRKKKSLTQDELSVRLGINRVTLARIEKGQRKIFFDVLIRFMSELEITYFEIAEIIRMNSIDDELAQQGAGKSDRELLKTLIGDL